MEIGLVRAFHWSLYDLDRTDIESLLPFVVRLGSQAGPGPAGRPGRKGGGGRRAFCDEVGWL